MRVAIVGGTGFVGHYIVEQLLTAEMTPVLLVRPGSEERVPWPEKVEIVSGDVDDESAVNALMQNADAAIYLIGILRAFPAQGITFEALQHEGAVRVIDAAVSANVPRFLLMSANGVRSDGTPYQQTKVRAEEYLKTTLLKWTILRPSVLFGDPHGRMEFATQLTKELIKPPIPAPLFFDGLKLLSAGQFEMAPTHVDDVAKAFVRSITSEKTIGQTLNLCGPANISWKNILTILATSVGKKKWMLPAPAWGIKLVATFLDRYAFFPISRDQLTMLLEGNVCDSNSAYRMMDITPQSFSVETLSYLKKL